MADPEAEDAQFVHDPETGVVDLQLSQWFDFQTFDTPRGYIERVTPLIVESVESRLGISSWHRRFYPETPLHPSYVALGGEIPPLIFGVIAPPPEDPLIEPVQSDRGLKIKERGGRTARAKDKSNSSSKRLRVHHHDNSYKEIYGVVYVSRDIGASGVDIYNEVQLWICTELLQARIKKFNVGKDV